MKAKSKRSECFELYKVFDMVRSRELQRNYCKKLQNHTNFTRYNFERSNTVKLRNRIIFACVITLVQILQILCHTIGKQTR